MGYRERMNINDMYSNSTEFTNVVSDAIDAAGFNNEVLVRMKLSLGGLIPQQDGV